MLFLPHADWRGGRPDASQDHSNLYIALIGQTAAIVPLVVKLAADVKWKHYKASGEDLQTFIDDGGPNANSSRSPKDCEHYSCELVSLWRFG